MYAYSILVLVSVLFCFMVGCSGYSEVNGTIQDTVWVVEDQECTTMFHTLRALFYNGGTDGAIIPFTECADTSKACATFGLMFTAFILAVIISIVFGLFVRSSLHLSGRSGARPKIRVILIALALATVGISLGALVDFMGDCYHGVDDHIGEDLVWGPESLLSLMGLLLMICARVKKMVCRLSLDTYK